MNNAGITDNRPGFIWTAFLLFDDDPFFKTILSAMSFVSHDNDITPRRQRLFAPFEFEHRRENDTIRFPAIE